MSHGGGAGLVHAVAQVIENTVVLHQILGGSAGGGYLIAQAPANDRRMVIALGHQLPHLIDGVLPSIRHVLCDVGDFRPDDDAILVAKVIEFLCVLIVGKAHRVGTDFTDNVHVLPMFIEGKRITKTLPVLMAADTPQRVHSAVEQKALVRVKADGAAAKTGGYQKLAVAV